MPEEEWRAIPGWEGLYEVSSDGRVRSLPYSTPTRGTQRGRMLKAAPDTRGYPAVHLCDNGTELRRHRLVRVHILVALAFIGPRQDGMEVRHLDDVKTNNNLDNLAYGTHAENMADSMRNGTHVALVKLSATHCKVGHEYTPDNLRVLSNGKTRSCRTCNRAADRERYHAKRSKS